MDDSNLTVNAMWIGKSLSACELLTIKSFLNNGHKFVLWAYDDIVTPLPAGTVLRDATEIIPRDKVFSYKYSNQFGHGKGSFAGFSDIFRYKLLYLHGGWWVDMDVTCLKPLAFSDDYVFRSHHDLPLVGNVMKCPKGSHLMEKCYNDAVSKVNENNRDWHLPIQILVDNVASMGLSGCVKSFSNKDSWNDVRKMLYKNVIVPNDWSIIHWVNEEWRRNGINRKVFLKSSLFSELARRNDVHIEYAGIFKSVQTRFKLSLLWHGLMQ
ncbi:MAG: hypothetical protein J6T63_07840 [Bacteroidales bacterium]|nr:hypothetical protein [Bacteroidales bacterium]